VAPADLLLRHPAVRHRRCFLCILFRFLSFGDKEEITPGMFQKNNAASVRFKMGNFFF
jgi:hypothetical protein